MSERAPLAAIAWAVWRAALFGALAVVAAANVVVVATYFHFPYGERGWTIDFVVHNAWELVHGQPVFVDPAAGNPTALLYTPGLTLLLAPLVAVFGRELWVARLLAAAGALLLLALLTRETARRVRDQRLVVLAPGLMFLLGTATEWDLITVHPETWATVFAFGALLAARRVMQTGRALGWAVAATCAAVATKQTMLCYAPAIAFALAGRSRRSAGLYLLGVAGLLAMAAGLAQAATGGQFLKYTLLAERQSVDWGKLPDVAAFVAYHFGLLLPLLVLERWRGGWRGFVRDPFLCAAVITLPALTAAMLKPGSGGSNLLGPAVLLVILFVESLDRALPLLRRSAALSAAAAGVGLLCVIGRAKPEFRMLWNDWLARGPRQAAAERIDGALRASAGSAWMPFAVAFAWRNGVPVEAPSLLLSEFSATEPAVTGEVLAKIDAAAFDTILLPPTFYRMLPEAVFGPRLAAHYDPVEVIGVGTDWGLLTPVTVLRRRE